MITAHDHGRVWINGWPAVVVVTVRPLAAGDEVLANYGEDWWRGYHHERRRRAAAASPRGAG